MPRIGSRHRKLGRIKEGFYPESQKEHEGPEHFGFGPVASRNGREYMSVALIHPVCVFFFFLLSSPKKLKQ